MCSRYYIDLDMMEEISRVVQNIDGRIRLTQGDIRPTDVAPVIGQSEHGLELVYADGDIEQENIRNLG